MTGFDDNDFREFLLCYRVPEPGIDLVDRTKRLIHEELLVCAAAPAAESRGLFMIVLLSIAMTLCLFYMLTVGTILTFVLPAGMETFLRHSFYMLSAAGGSLLACALMMFVFKALGQRRTVDTYGRVGC